MDMQRSLKAAVAVLLIGCFLFCLLPMGSSYAAQLPLRIMTAADTHFQCEADLGDFSDAFTENLLDADMFGYASTQGQMHYESEAILAGLLSAFEESDAAYLLIAGDLTCGKRLSHLAFARHLKRAEQISGKQIFVINGNHDCSKKSDESGVSMEEFREIYADFGYNEAASLHRDSASYTVDLNETYRLLAVDSCVYGEDEGEIGASVFRWIRTQTEQAEKDGKTLIAMMHHSILPHYELQPMIRLWQYYASWFADHGIQTVLTGHIHANDISSTVSDRGNMLFDIQTGALISAPNTFRMLTFLPDSVEVESRFLTQIDVSLLPSMLTEQQRSLLQSDFPTYAHAYFVSGVGKWLNRNVGSVNRLARWFNLKEGTAAYEAAKRLTGTLGDAVGLDIYDTGRGKSIEAVLRPYGIPVPQSDYQKPYEVAATLMYGFFHGDEQTVSSKADAALLLTCLQGAVLSAARHMSNRTALGALVAAVTGKALSVRALREWSERWATALLQTMAGGIVDDYSAPTDLNATLQTIPRGDAVTLHPLIRFFRLITGLAARQIPR